MGEVIGFSNEKGSLEQTHAIMKRRVENARADLDNTMQRAAEIEEQNPDIDTTKMVEGAQELLAEAESRLTEFEEVHPDMRSHNEDLANAA